MQRAFRFVTLMLCMVMIAISCSNSNADYEALAERNVQCPEGAHLEYLPWGESGMRAVCIMESGPIVIAEGGYVVIEGQYSKGKQVGEWRWFDAPGKVFRTERYGTTE
jgi:hypothetical protein